MIEVSSTLFELQIKISRCTNTAQRYSRSTPKTMRGCMRGVHSVQYHEDCIKHTDMLAEYYGVLQLAKCCNLQ